MPASLSPSLEPRGFPPRALASLVAAAFVAITAGPVHASAPDCATLGPLAAQGLERLEIPLPAQPGDVSVWLVLDAGTGPLALPVIGGGPDRAAVVLPVAADRAGLETDAMMIAQTADGRLHWLCDRIEVAILPLPARPGGTERLADRFDGMTDALMAALDVLPADTDMAPVAALLPAMATELRSLARDLPEADLAEVDAVLGAYLAALVAAASPDALAATPSPPGAPPNRRPFRRTPAEPGVLRPAHQQSTGSAVPIDVCPAGPLALTDAIRVGALARAHTESTAQFLLTSSVTLFGVSGRLINAATARNKRIESAIDNSVLAINTTQALVGDFLAGMMPLNLDRLDLVHTGAHFLDDTPPGRRDVTVTHARLHTRSNGWSPDKAALDAILALASAVPRGSAAGVTSTAASSQLRQNAERLDRIATTVGNSFGVDLAVTRSVLRTTRRNADNAHAIAEGVELSVATAVGTAEGQITGQVTGAAGSSDLAPIGRQVARCIVDLVDVEDGSRPQHLFLSIEEGDDAVAVPALEPPLTLDIVGTGERTAVVRLNPASGFFPLPQATTLPEARFQIDVEQIDIDIDGPGPEVAAGDVLTFTATTEGVGTPPRLVWSVTPTLPIQTTGFEAAQATLTLPQALPDETIITVTATALGEFISDAQETPQQSIVLVVREPSGREAPAEEEAPEEETAEGALSCGPLLQNLTRPRSLSSGQALAGNWREVASVTVEPSSRTPGRCFEPSYLDTDASSLVIASGPDGLSVPHGAGTAPLGRIDAEAFLSYLQVTGGPLPDHHLYRSCLTPPGFTELSSWLTDPATEVFVVVAPRPGSGDCRGFIITDGNYLMHAGNLMLDWHVIMRERQ